MTEEDEEFNRIEREAAMRKEAVRTTVTTRKEWVGLTTVERAHIYNNLPTYEWMQAVEDKLREKNCGV